MLSTCIVSVFIVICTGESLETNEILKHELKIVELKLSLKKNGGKSDSKLKA